MEGGAPCRKQFEESAETPFFSEDDTRSWPLDFNRHVASRRRLVPVARPGASPTRTACTSRSSSSRVGMEELDADERASFARSEARLRPSPLARFAIFLGGAGCIVAFALAGNKRARVGGHKKVELIFLVLSRCYLSFISVYLSFIAAVSQHGAPAIPLLSRFSLGFISRLSHGYLTAISRLSPGYPPDGAIPSGGCS